MQFEARYYPTTVICTGDSWGTTNFNGDGQIVAPLYVTALGGFASLFYFNEAPEGFATAYGFIPALGGNGWYLTDPPGNAGIKGYTEDGVFLDRMKLMLAQDDIPIDVHWYCQGGSDVYTGGGGGGTWDDGIPADPADWDDPSAYSGLFDQNGKSGTRLADLLADPPTDHVTLMHICGGNDVLLQGHLAGPWSLYPDTSATVAATTVPNLTTNFQRFWDAIYTLVPDRVTLEAVTPTYSHFPIDDPRGSFYEDGADQFPPVSHSYHTPTGDPDEDFWFQSPNLAPGEANSISFPPNAGWNGFAFHRTVIAGTHQIVQWTIDGTANDQFLRYYGHWYADHFWSSVWWQPTPAAKWNTAYGIGYGNANIDLSLLGRRINYGVRNITSDLYNGGFRRMIDPAWEAARAYNEAAGRAHMHVDLWNALEPWAGTGPEYPHGLYDRWIDGTHLSYQGTVEWCDALLDTWLRSTIHRRWVVPMSGKLAPSEVGDRRSESDPAIARPDNTPSYRRSVTTVEGPAIPA